MTAVGTPIVRATDFGRRVPSDAIDAEQAMHSILGAYLLSLEFVETGRAGTTFVPSRCFGLRDVFDEWPDPNADLPYPCASLSATTVPLMRSALTPDALPETYGVYDGAAGTARTALWKLGEAEADVQIDFWTNGIGEREAIAARLPGAFAPGEDVDRVLLTGTPLYWQRPLRVQLREVAREDRPMSLISNEWRLRATVRCTIDVVDLRCGSLLDVRSHLTAGELVEIATGDA